jgi:hypothetical protein
LLTEHRDKEAALRFLKKTIRRNGVPETITIDGSDANEAAITSYNAEHGTHIAIRQVKWRNKYLMTENRILRNQITGRIQLSDGERKALAEIGQKLGKQALVAKIVQPDTILGWHRKLVAKKFDGSPQRKAPGRPPID